MLIKWLAFTIDLKAAIVGYERAVHVPRHIYISLQHQDQSAMALLIAFWNILGCIVDIESGASRAWKRDIF
jgi:4'-phosphopantetheinyl transferase EntD